MEVLRLDFLSVMLYQNHHYRTSISLYSNMGPLDLNGHLKEFDLCLLLFFLSYVSCFPGNLTIKLLVTKFVIECTVQQPRAMLVCFPFRPWSINFVSIINGQASAWGFCIVGLGRIWWIGEDLIYATLSQYLYFDACNLISPWFPFATGSTKLHS